MFFQVDQAESSVVAEASCTDQPVILAGAAAGSAGAGSAEATCVVSAAALSSAVGTGVAPTLGAPSSGTSSTASTFSSDDPASGCTTGSGWAAATRTGCSCGTRSV